MFGRSLVSSWVRKSSVLKRNYLIKSDVQVREVYIRYGRKIQTFCPEGSAISYYYLRNFSQNSLNEVFSDSSKQQFIKHVEELKYKNSKHGARDAAVLVPLCRVNSKPSILLTLRSSNLGRNKGDVSFPGGMRDNSDKNVIDSALRETAEEIGITLNADQIWTTMPSISRSGMQVTPVIAFLGDINVKDFQFNESEVEQVFSLPLESFCISKNQFYTEFKPGYSLPVYLIDGYRVWGLTAGILHLLLHILLPDMYINDLPIIYKGLNRRQKKDILLH